MADPLGRNIKTMPRAASSTKGRVCWLCEHVMFFAGSPGYSELTPGNNFELSCGKHYWEFDQFDDTLDQFRDKLMSAERCADFKKSTA